MERLVHVHVHVGGGGISTCKRKGGEERQLLRGGEG